MACISLRGGNEKQHTSSCVLSIGFLQKIFRAAIQNLHNGLELGGLDVLVICFNFAQAEGVQVNTQQIDLPNQLGRLHFLFGANSLDVRTDQNLIIIFDARGFQRPHLLKNLLNSAIFSLLYGLDVVLCCRNEQ